MFTNLVYSVGPTILLDINLFSVFGKIVLGFSIYLVYLILGFIVLHIVGQNQELANWVYSRPNAFLFGTIWSLWPVVVIWYYIQSQRKRE